MRARAAFGAWWILRRQVSPSLAKQLSAACDWTTKPDAACAALIEQMQSEIGHVNLYNIYGPGRPRRPCSLRGGEPARSPRSRTHTRTSGPRLSRARPPAQASASTGCRNRRPSFTRSVSPSAERRTPNPRLCRLASHDRPRSCLTAACARLCLGRLADVPTITKRYTHPLERSSLLPFARAGAVGRLDPVHAQARLGCGGARRRARRVHRQPAGTAP